MRETELIEWIIRQGRLDPSVVPVGPGDDCAVVMCGSEALLVTVDQVLDGVHLHVSEHGAVAAGRKALARNLSDIAAMAGVPLVAVASVAAPAGMDHACGQGIYEGLRELGESYACPIVGGDVAVWDGALQISVTVIGRPGPKGPVLRSGARVGDAVCVTGRLGGAWRGEHHLTFEPRIAAGAVLAERYDAHAMIDISDGLTTDLGHLCSASGVGAELIAATIPLRPGADLPAALGDGEDYELLFTLPPEVAQDATTHGAAGVDISHIGRIVEGAGMTLILQDGTRNELAASGWEHGA